MTLRERRDYYALKKKKLWKKYQSSKEKKTIGEIYYKESKGFRQILRSNKSDLFYRYFEEGLLNYIEGDWEDANQNLCKALYLDKNDGPTRTLLDYIKKLKLKQPEDLDGFRVLTNKT